MREMGRGEERAPALSTIFSTTMGMTCARDVSTVSHCRYAPDESRRPQDDQIVSSSKIDNEINVLINAVSDFLLIKLTILEPNSS